jgi:tellurite resistance protein TerC
MITIPGLNPVFMWIGFIALVLLFLFLDLWVFNKKQHEITIKEALLWTLVWFGLAMLFNVFIWLEFGHVAGLQFFTGYLIEKSLSVDNLFVILLIFTSFRIAPKFQHRILFWGILGALVMRGLMIGLGTALIARWSWILYIFGAFLLYAGFKMFLKNEEDFDPHDSFVVRLVRRFVHVSKNHEGDGFIFKERGKMAVSLGFVALLVVEVTDVAFAFDSIPAIFAITLDPFIVFTSNVFAILGLRSLYFVIAKAHGIFNYLSYGLGIILVFIGLKMLLSDFVHINIFMSLSFVVLVLAGSMILSIFTKEKILKP